MSTKNMVVVVALGALGVACAGNAVSDGDSVSSASAATEATPAAITPGAYVLDDDDVGATLTIKTVTADRVTYDYGILGKTGSHHDGDLVDRTARLQGTSFVDVVDSDCQMSFRLVGKTIQLAQSGSCSDAGFGAFLDGTGTYEKKKASPWLGLYEKETTHRAWAIRVSSEAPFTFRIVAGNYDHLSEAVDAKDLVATLSDGTALFESGGDCSISMKKVETGVELVQTGTCASISFPANEDLSMSDDTGTNFNALDESQQCFDTTALSVVETAGGCENPM